jgi:RNA polymerase sigma-70 factor (ECF subfamily)
MESLHGSRVDDSTGRSDMNDADEFIPTRQSLLSRLKDWADQESWKVFFDTYWRLIYNAAIRAGLTDAEAQDVVQETVISVSKSLAAGGYDPTKSSFKTWLMRLTGWRIIGQFRKRPPPGRSLSPRTATSTRTDTVERIADETIPSLETLWEEEWENNLLKAALRRVKAKVDARQYQIFDLYVQKNWPVAKVAKDMRVNRARVYLVKHRITKLIKKEIDHLKTKPI